MTRSLPERLDLAAGTDVGLRRSVNQDEAAVLTGEDGSFALLLVCDGIGGLARGDVASRTVVHAVTLGMAECAGVPIACLRRAIEDAHRAINEESSLWERMGTTVVAVLCTDSGVEVLHAGDSRAYLFRHGALEGLTTDHSWVMERVQAGLMTVEEAEQDSRRNIITRAVGTEEELRLERTSLGPLLPGDIVMACTDGLHGPVPRAVMEEVLRGSANARGAVDGLIAAANERGGPDNVGIALGVMTG
ncbi:MAG: PP2C family protein-serine/threonine phosphatase [Dehalococcoidia bacterium]